MPNKKLVEDLRKQMRRVSYITLARELGSQIIDTLAKTIDQLEAADKAFNTQFERAEAAEAHIAENQALKSCMNVLADILSVNTETKEVIDAVQKLAKLKGDAVPVYQIWMFCSGENSGYDWEEVNELDYTQYGGKKRTLFTNAQPVPVVVLSDSYTCPRCKRTTTRPNGEHYCHVKSADGEEA